MGWNEIDERERDRRWLYGAARCEMDVDMVAGGGAAQETVAGGEVDAEEKSQLGRFLR